MYATMHQAMHASVYCMIEHPVWLRDACCQRG